MSQFEKLWDRFLLVPSDFTYDELRKIMKHYGYSENNKGKTSGSRVVFIKRDDVEKTTIFLHKPHGMVILNEQCYSVQRVFYECGI